jgi:hypothetical protein
MIISSSLVSVLIACGLLNCSFAIRDAHIFISRSADIIRWRLFRYAPDSSVGKF